jgi:hypothetical protein
MALPSNINNANLNFRGQPRKRAPTKTSGGRGRPVGSVNKVTQDIREMILASFHQAGGVRYLVKQSAANPVAYMGLLGKIVPMQINATIKREITELTREELIAIASGGKVIEHEAEASSALQIETSVDINELEGVGAIGPIPDPILRPQRKKRRADK